MNDRFVSFGIWLLLFAFAGILLWPVDLYQGAPGEATAGPHERRDPFDFHRPTEE